MAKWIKQHKMTAPTAGQEQDLTLARSMFESWDTENLGRLSFLQIADQLTSLGLVGNPNRALRILRMFKRN